MKLSDRLKKKIETERFTTVEFLGETVLVKQLSIAKYIELGTLLETDQEAAAQQLAPLMIDPETKKPIFTAEFILDEMPQAIAVSLIKAIIPSVDLGQAEKN